MENLRQVTAENIEPMWPRAAAAIAPLEETYLLATDDTTGQITLLGQKGGLWTLIEDTWDEDGAVKSIALTGEGTANLAQIALAKFAEHKETAGRPKLYTTDNEGRDIFIRHTYEGKTIRALAAELNMSPSTVQKLLNETKMKTAEQIFAGELPLNRESPYWQKNIALLRWAVKRMSGAKRQTCERFVEQELKK